MIGPLPPLVAAGGAVWIATVVMVIVMLWRAARRPMTAVDYACAALDLALDQGAPVETEPDGVACLAARMRALGDVADAMWPAHAYAPVGDPEFMPVAEAVSFVGGPR